MTPEFVTSMGKDTIEVILMVSGPILLVGMVVGLLISLFQAVTQIQEMTLSFVPKILAVFVALLVLSPWLMDVMIRFTSKIFINIPQYVR